MSYPWMITFADLTDEIIRKRGDTYLTTHPDPAKNYYDLTAAKYINFVNSFNIDVAVLNGQVKDQSAVNHIHYNALQWLITAFQMEVCRNNIGLNNVDGGVSQDLYYIKYKQYMADLNVYQGNLNYETIVSGAIQQNYTRAGNRFRIMSW